MVKTRQNAPKRRGLVVSVQLQGLLDIVRMEKKKPVDIACREYVKQFNVKFQVKSSRKQRGRCCLGGKGAKLRRAAKQGMHNKVLASSEGHEDDYFATKLRSRWKFGRFWKGRLLADEESSSDEEEEGDIFSKPTSMGQSLKETVESKPFEILGVEESTAYDMGKTLEEDGVQRKAMGKHFEVKGPVKVTENLGNVSPSPWCCAVASYTSKASRARMHGTPKLWRSPSPSLVTEKQHAAFQSRKLKEINSRIGKSRKTNLVKCLQKDFDEEVFVKKEDFASDVSVKKCSIGFLASADNCMETGRGFGALLAQINCAIKQKEGDCSESECEEYFSDP